MCIRDSSLSLSLSLSLSFFCVYVGCAFMIIIDICRSRDQKSEISAKHTHIHTQTCMRSAREFLGLKKKRQGEEGEGDENTIRIPIDESKLTMENLDNLNEEEILLLEEKMKNERLPSWRVWALIPYNIGVAGLCYYYTINFRRLSKKLFKPRKYGFIELIKYGSIQAILFATTYTLGTCAVTGLWHPVKYAQDLAKIQGKIIDLELRFDETIQENFLYNSMRYFGLSEEMVKQAQQDIEGQKKMLEERQYFMKNKKILGFKMEKEEDEDDEDNDKEASSKKEKVN
eukprot:TRINITY_DN746_c0_g1_i15.p1 TRINITY_DN746_c0_g1~~TRINITY_DN746_c0_g1_i15.p1  ORF type:complete len:286 (-),score=80.03 TRINITY_DN746_c0_g1_i15:332-1189(-)